jgi:hypothetical protein
MIVLTTKKSLFWKVLKIKVILAIKSSRFIVDILYSLYKYKSWQHELHMAVFKWDVGEVCWLRLASKNFHFIENLSHLQRNFYKQPHIFKYQSFNGPYLCGPDYILGNFNVRKRHIQKSPLFQTRNKSWFPPNSHSGNTHLRPLGPPAAQRTMQPTYLWPLHALQSIRPLNELTHFLNCCRLTTRTKSQKMKLKILTQINYIPLIANKAAA